MNAMPAIDMAATGSNIVRMRRSAGMTVQDLQQVFGFSTPQAIYKWQRGAAMPTLDNLVVLAAVFGTTLDAIIVRTGPRS
ncbi:MAG: helix-turn-helix transcriptional regulator [Clostridia bacterium]|nr:helix-turn-helix transcriptional regulator [Clostridia bacterium]